jgi:hypothetical protein
MTPGGVIFVELADVYSAPKPEDIEVSEVSGKLTQSHHIESNIAIVAGT